MRALELTTDLAALADRLTDPVLVVATDGWTDAGTAGSSAAELLLDQFATEEVGAFDPDVLYDYRDRRPVLQIDQGTLGEPRWPSLHLELVTPTSGPSLLVLTGAEPDLRWRTIIDDLAEFAAAVGARRYVGLGAVPGPLPHTRPVQLICTSSEPDLLARFGQPHEQVVVPSSFQVAAEAELRTAGLTTLGLWARLPHYVATDYPAATKALLERFSAFTGTPVDIAALDEPIADQREQLDEAAAASDEITEHVHGLESMYDAMVADEGHQRFDVPGGDPMSSEQVPSGDEIAAELERFLRGRAD